LLRDSRVLEEAVASGSVTLLSAVYDLHDGTVHWQMQLMAAVAGIKATARAVRGELHADDSHAEPPASTVKSDTKQAAAKPRGKKTAEESATYARRYR
jgi:hypothetical protein